MVYTQFYLFLCRMNDMIHKLRLIKKKIIITYTKQWTVIEYNKLQPYTESIEVKT